MEGNDLMLGGMVIVMCCIVGLIGYNAVMHNSGEVVQCVVYEEISCINDGNQVYYLNTNIGRINISPEHYTIPHNIPIEIRLHRVAPLYNRDPRLFESVYNSPCGVVP